MPNEPTRAEASPLREAVAPEQREDELAREKQEVLRLRDLLIARDAELGAALGRLTELEARSKRLTGIAKKIAGGFRRS